jgi:plastocyanin
MFVVRTTRWRACLAVIAAAGCGGIEQVVPPPDAAISVGEYYMQPDTVTVDAGQVVRWTNSGSANHQVNVVLPDTTYQSVVLPPGWWFEVRFDAAGTFAVFCSQRITPDDTTSHPERSTVVVR